MELFKKKKDCSGCAVENEGGSDQDGGNWWWHKEVRPGCTAKAKLTGFHYGMDERTQEEKEIPNFPESFNLGKQKGAFAIS